MKREAIQRLREDFPDLIGPTSALSEDMPEAWETTLRVLLVRLRDIKFGRRRGTVPCEITVRALGAAVKSYLRRPSYLALDVALSVKAKQKNSTAIKSEIRHAVWSCREADLKTLRDSHALDIVDLAVMYVRKTVSAGRFQVPRDAIFTSVYDTDEVRHSMPSWVLEAVGRWLKGQPLGDLTEADRSRFLGIYKRDV